jgi:3-deoxy-manno-octulosonate cytidylyltransferase (CMP-KDO synthetase)
VRECTVIIPARLGSERLPGKVLLDGTGRPLVQHVVERAVAADVGPVVVAADSPEIVAALEPFGTQVVLTRSDHPSGTDRIAEVAAGRGEAVVVNVQGDEPEIEPAAIRAVAELAAEGVATASVPYPAEADPHDPALVKVVTDDVGRALYFSRAAVPFVRDSSAAMARRLHVGLYAYPRQTLLKLAGLPPGGLERCEKLEQLRWLAAGFPIRVAALDGHAGGIDTPAQYAAFVDRYQRIKP